MLNERFMQSGAPLNVQWRRPVTQRFALHWHEFFELTYVHAGAGTNIVNGKPQPIAEGDIWLLTPADFHEIMSEPGTPMTVTNLQFKREFVTDELYELLFARDMVLRAEVPPAARAELAAWLDRIQAETRGVREGIREGAQGKAVAAWPAAKALFELVVIQLIRLLSTLQQHESGSALRHESSSPLRTELPLLRRSPSPSQPAWLSRVLLFMEHHFREDITLRAVAEQAGLSDSYFSDRFRKTTGVTFQQHLLQIRLSFARSLMLGSQLPVTEVCYVSGFRTLTYFEKAYRSKFGSSPRQSRLAAVQRSQGSLDGSQAAIEGS
jgi:AraC-like DNA-binding protein